MCSWVRVIGRFKVIPLMLLGVVLWVGLKWFPWWFHKCCYGWVVGDFIGGLRSVFLVVFKIALVLVYGGFIGGVIGGFKCFLWVGYR